MHNNSIQKLRETIMSQDVTKLSEKTELFCGADVIVSNDPNCPDSNGWSVYTKVVTPFAKEVSWLLIEIKGIFEKELDYMNKYYFFSLLADNANRCIANGKGGKTELLLGILEAADTIEI